MKEFDKKISGILVALQRVEAALQSNKVPLPTSTPPNNKPNKNKTHNTKRTVKKANLSASSESDSSSETTSIDLSAAVQDIASSLKSIQQTQLEFHKEIADLKQGNVGKNFKEDTLYVEDGDLTDILEDRTTY